MHLIDRLAKLDDLGGFLACLRCSDPSLNYPPPESRAARRASPANGNPRYHDDHSGGMAPWVTCYFDHELHLLAVSASSPRVARLGR